MKKNINEFSDVRYRPARKEDCADICKIYNSHIDHGGSTFETEYWQACQLASQITGNEIDHWFVAEQNTKIIGWSAARIYSNRYGYRLTREIAIYLSIEHIGNGYANKLLELTEQICRDNGVHHLVSRVITCNQQSLRFHNRHGYEIVGIQKEIGKLKGEWLDVAILQKILD